MKTSFERVSRPKSGVVVVFCDASKALHQAAAELDKTVGGQIGKAIAATHFEGKRDQTVDILSPGGGLDRIMVLGLGKREELTLHDLELLGGTIAGMLQTAKVKSATITALDNVKGIAAKEAVARMAHGATLRVYTFDSYKTKKPETANGLTALYWHCQDPSAAKSRFAQLDAVREGNHLARDLVNEPSNILYPVAFANRCKALSKSGVKVEILTPAKMKNLGMGALLGVAQGSAFEPRLVVMRWDGGKKGETPIAFVGKGVTFDTGGVSIKPAAGMEEMKGDMAGAACVTGLMLALAKRKAKCNVIGAIGLVENAVDGKAQRPGDVVKSMSGQTIAVLNTDAEGRLVLADVLWYIQDRFKPKFMVDLATLTGAIMVALGKENAGLFSNNDELATRIISSGLATGEKVWRMPLAPEYDKLIDHDVADMKNIGGRFGGSITGAQFIQRFVNNVPWAHLDIAGTATDSVKSSINQSWASGWGVRLLNHMVAEHYEK